MNDLQSLSPPIVELGSHFVVTFVGFARLHSLHPLCLSASLPCNFSSPLLIFGGHLRSLQSFTWLAICLSLPYTDYHVGSFIMAHTLLSYAGGSFQSTNPDVERNDVMSAVRRHSALKYTGSRDSLIGCLYPQTLIWTRWCSQRQHRPKRGKISLCMSSSDAKM